MVGQMPAGDFKFLPSMDFYEIAAWIGAWSVLGIGSIPSQDVFQRVMSSGSERTAVLSCFYAAGLYLTVAMIPLFISLCTKHLYPDHLNGDLQLVLPRMVLEHTAVWVQVLFFGSLLSAIMSTPPARPFSHRLLFFLKILFVRFQVLLFQIKHCLT